MVVRGWCFSYVVFGGRRRADKSKGFDFLVLRFCFCYWLVRGFGRGFFFLVGFRFRYMG